LSDRCTATTQTGKPCRAWAVVQLDSQNPPLCAAHGGGKSPVGAPEGNKNALKHGLFTHPDAPPLTINAIIEDLAEKQTQLSSLIEEGLRDDPNIDNLARLFALHGQNASRLGRLLRDQRALSGAAADGIAGAIAQALDELSTELGTEL